MSGSLPSRYARQARLPGWGEPAQARLSAAHAVVVGVGGLGCPAADGLARAGVGRLTLIDRDLVDESNLHRQTLYTDADARDRLPKAVAAAERLRAVNPDVRIEPIIADVTSANAEAILIEGPLGTPDVILEGVDGFETRFLLNDVAVKHTIPLVHGGAVATRGSHGVLVTPPEDGAPRACLRCLLDGVPPPGSQPTCDTAGVLGPLVSIVGARQAADALRLLATGEAPTRLESFELVGESRTSIDLHRAYDVACPCCGQRRFEYLDAPPPATAPGLCGREAVQIEPNGVAPDLERVAASWAGLGSVRTTPMMARLRLDAQSAVDGEQALVLTLFGDGRAIVEGTTDPARARAVYARYVGS